jgi:predicted transcriptional regulator
MAEYKIELSDEDLAKITALAKKRRVSASKIIQQAIATETLISQNVDPSKDELLIKRGGNLKKVIFK